MLSVPYLSGDSGVSMDLSKLQHSSTRLSLEVDVTVNWKELLDDGLMPVHGSNVERRAPEPVLRLKTDVTSTNNELFRDDHMPILYREVERGVCPNLS